jgi:hypothetical protein
VVFLIRLRKGSPANLPVGRGGSLMGSLSELSIGARGENGGGEGDKGGFTDCPSFGTSTVWSSFSATKSFCWEPGMSSFEMLAISSASCCTLSVLSRAFSALDITIVGVAGPCNSVLSMFTGGVVGVSVLVVSCVVFSSFGVFM